MPRVILYDAITPEEDMPKLYRSAHAFVLMSRGEGMGMPYLEAGACGLPVIGTACTAQLDFLNEDNSWLVEPDSFESSEIADSREINMAKQCRFYEGQDFPVFGHNSLEQAQEAMREVYDDYDRAKEKGERFRQDICESFTWNHTVNMITDRLEEL